LTVIPVSVLSALKITSSCFFPPKLRLVCRRLLGFAINRVRSQGKFCSSLCLCSPLRWLVGSLFYDAFPAVNCIASMIRFK
jgi:hypothetical protein